MRTFSIHRTVDHDWAEMFALVLDIELYPQFVPGCAREQVFSRREVTPGCTEIVSRMTVGVPPLQFGYTNRTLGDRQARRISVDSADGPLRQLSVTWQFEPCGETRSQVDLHVDYEFRNPIVARLASGVFESMFRRIVDAFEQRASVRHHSPSKCGSQSLAEAPAASTAEGLTIAERRALLGFAPATARRRLNRA